MMKAKQALIQRGVFNILTVLIGLGLLLVFAFSLNALFTLRSQQPLESASRPRGPTVQQSLSTPTPTANQPQAPTSQQLSPPPTLAPSQTDPTAGWKEYTSASLGYSIKYPSDWNLREVPNVVFSSPNIAKTPGGTVTSGGEIVIFLHDNSSNKLLSEFYNSLNSYDFHAIERKELTINNLPALWYVAQGAGIDGTMTGTMIAVPNKIYRIESYYGRNNRDEIVKVLELMLKSMKFVTK